jgi:hypothetical protein
MSSTAMAPIAGLVRALWDHPRKQISLARSTMSVAENICFNNRSFLLYCVSDHCTAIIFMKMSEKIEMEYTFNTSPRVLYNRLSTPAGLAEWFAEDVNLKNELFSFVLNFDQFHDAKYTKYVHWLHGDIGVRMYYLYYVLRITYYE